MKPSNLTDDEAIAIATLHGMNLNYNYSYECYTAECPDWQDWELVKTVTKGFHYSYQPYYPKTMAQAAHKYCAYYKLDEPS